MPAMNDNARKILPILFLKLLDFMSNPSVRRLLAINMPMTYTAGASPQAWHTCAGSPCHQHHIVRVQPDFVAWNRLGVKTPAAKISLPVRISDQDRGSQGHCPHPCSYEVQSHLNTSWGRS